MSPQSPPSRRPFRACALGACSLLLVACGGDGVGPGSGQDPDPVALDFPLVYVKRVLPRDQDGGLIQGDLRRPASFNAGADLYLRPRAAVAAPERNLTETLTGGLGDVRDLEVSYDGERVLFALRLPEIENADEDEQPTWNIWEYDIAADRLRRVISADITAREGQDLAPTYLPDGRILFSSTRQQGAGAVLLDEGKEQFAALEESLREPALVLHVMNADGTGIRQLSYNQSHDLDPAVLGDGRIVFSRWEQMGGRSAVHYYTINPDGTGLQLLYGANSHASGSDGDTVQFVQPRPLADGRLLGLIRPFSGTDDGGDLVFIDAANFSDLGQPVAGAGGVAQQPATALRVTTAAGISSGGRIASAYPLNDGTGRILLSWTNCRLSRDGELRPCTQANLADPAAAAADPLYGLWIYDPVDATLKPVIDLANLGEGEMFSEVVAVEPRPNPARLGANPGQQLDAQCQDDGLGVIHIRSVYDLDGLDTAPGGIAAVADPAQTPATQRSARFLRLVKAVGIPDDDVRDFANTAFGVNRGQLMREIIGYVPVEPDGSVKVRVPARVPLAISVLDANGRRIGPRHRNWLQLQAGEVLECNGCHVPGSGVAHGRRDAEAPSVNAGAPVTGLPFPNTDPALFADFGESMAETRTRIASGTGCNGVSPAVDPAFEDVWTDPALGAGDADLAYPYADLLTPAPTIAECQTAWTPDCRIVINYETHIQPLWERSRITLAGDGSQLADRTCTGCHDGRDAAGMPRVPDAQLDLSATPSDQQADHLTAYRELLVADAVQDVIDGVLQDLLVPATNPDGSPIFATDADGQTLFETDANGDLVLDANGAPIPVPLLVTIRAPGPSMSPDGAAAGYFFSLFDPGGSHAGDLEPAELRLLAEWLDIGAQYFNNPFDAPEN